MERPAPLGEGDRRRSTSAKSLGLVGTSASLTSLNEGILEQLEYEGILCRRAPLSEMMLFLWKEASGNKKCDRVFPEIGKTAVGNP